MFPAVRLPVLGEETLTFKVHLARRAVETFRMPVLVKSFDPTISRFNGELTPVALGLKHGRPVFRAVDLPILIMKGAGANWLVTLTAQEAAHVKRVLHCVYHFSDDGAATFSTVRCEILLVIFLTEQLSLLFHKSNVDELNATVRIGADEMIRAPGLIQGGHERTPDGDSTRRADGNSHSSG
jgi:hypothetical protein